MDVAIVAVGRLKAGPERDLCARYLERAEMTGRGVGFHRFQVLEVAESRAGRPADRVSEEAQRLRDRLGRHGESKQGRRQRLLCLDADGEAWSSEELAGWLDRQADDGAAAEIAVVIGGADGLDAAFLADADGVLSLGRVTWPHQLVRIMAAEQLYRAMTILSGHPYHRA